MIVKNAILGKGLSPIAACGPRMPRILVCDTETTGLPDDPASALLEVSAVEHATHNPALDSFIAYAGSIPPESRAVHHITPEQVSPRGVAWTRSRLSEWLISNRAPDTVWAFHKRDFDLHFLPELQGQPTICTYRCALHLYPHAPGHSVQVLRYWLGAEPTQEELGALAPHRAIYDCYCTLSILEEMLKLCTVQELTRLSSSPVVLYRCRFGKHRGELWKDVPKDYLRWILKDPNFDPDIQHTARHHLGLL